MEGPNVATWFEDHYDGAPREIIDFFGGDGISLKGLDIADVGTGDGLIAAGLLHHSEAARVVGFDVLPFEPEELLGFMRAHDPNWTIPPNLQFVTSTRDGIPAENQSFDVVVSWSAFEHISDPVAMAGEIRRVLRPGGFVMIQVWPFFRSEHGGHLWENGSFDHMSGADPRDDIELNGISLDNLQLALLSGGLAPTKVELLSEAFHLPRHLMHLPLSEVGVSGVKLIAVPL